MNLNLPLLPHQRVFLNEVVINSVNNPGRRIALVGGYGTGKTRSLVTAAILLALVQPGSTGWLVAPTYKMSDDTLGPTFHKVLHENFSFLTARGIYEWKEGKKQVLLHLGGKPTQISFLSAEDPEKLVGPNLDWVGIDEPGIIKEESFERLLSRVRIGPRRVVFLTGTPEGMNWFAKKFDRPDATAGYRTVRAKGWHPDLDFYEKSLREDLKGQSAKIKAYVEGEFVPLWSGRAYDAFDNKLHVSVEIKVDYNQELILSCDFNINPMAWIIAQGNKRVGFSVVDELKLEGTTEDAIKHFIKKYPRNKFRSNKIHIYGDASGSRRHTVSHETDYQIMQRFLKDAGYKPILHVQAANPYEKDRIAAVNTAFSREKVIISSHCKSLIESLDITAWKKGTSKLDKPSGDTWTHWADALGYLCIRELPVHLQYSTGQTIQTHQTPLNAPQGFPQPRRTETLAW